MLRSVFFIAVTSAVLLPSAVAVGQEQENQPTFGQRLDRFRKNLFGGEKDETQVAMPQARAGGRAPADGRRRPMPNSQQRQPQYADDAGPLPERMTTAEKPSNGGAPRSSRRTFQPGYEPAPPRQPAEEMASSRDDDSAQMADTEDETSSDAAASASMPHAYAGPKRSTEPAPRTASRFEPTMADRKKSATENETTTAATKTEAAPTRTASLPRPKTVAVAQEAAPAEEAAVEEVAAKPIEPVTKTKTTKTAPRTLEERLAAARSQQNAKPTRPAATASLDVATTPATPKTERTAVVPAKKSVAKTITPAATAVAAETTSEPIAETTVAEKLLAEKPGMEERAVETAAVEAAPVHRVARVEKAAPQAIPAADSVSEVATSSPGDAVLFKQQSPVLSVETAGPRKIKIGTPSTYMVTMQNTGSVAAHDVVVSVKLPEWAEIAGSEPKLGSARVLSVDGGASLEWTIPALEAKSRTELNLSIIPRKSRPFELAISWTRTPEVSQASVEVQEPKLLMNLAGPDEIYFGEREVYKLTLSNPGTGEAENVVVRLLPTSAGDEQAVSHPIGNIAAGDSKIVELELTAKQTNTLEIKAEAVAEGGLHAAIDEVITVRRAEVQVAVQGPKLQYAGTPATYRVRVSNPGNAAAKNVQVSALIPRGANYLSSSDGGTVDADQRKVTWTIGNLRAGTEATMAFKCLLNSPGSNTAQVACHADGDIRHQGAATTEVEALADLTLKIVDPQGPVPVGQEITYEVRVLNRGTKAAENVEIMAFFSPGIEPVAVDQGHPEISAGQIAFAPVALVQAGQELVYKIRARADRAANHVFRAEVACPTLETKLSADETTRFYVDDSLEPDEAVAQPGELAPQEEPVEGESNELLPAEPQADEEVPADAPADESATEEPATDESAEPQPE